MTIDANGRPHAPEGTPNGGRFTAANRPDSVGDALATPPRFTIGSGHAPHESRLTGQLDGIDPDYRVHLLALNPYESGLLDWYVTRITDDSNLARAVPGRARTADARTWLALADADTSERGKQFAAGFREAVTTLMSEKLHEHNDRGAGVHELADAALTAATTKRAAKSDRDEWASQVQWAQNAGSQRGYLVAAAVLAGEDATWGFRDDVHETIHGGDDW
ncbi:hypothetical protein [Curtobacterium sp. MCSS17_016]|uniref:hypothetical protein n=1 Tax=Curtobacterium sp. MCSS17_016 TaxID=2175644 RepID=UPI0011B4DF95|nr:hypothetical protein [Curtobacterium sp. MCSS17_016]WIE81549.1 hypothetical protein DEJ19_020130 [Curtobacterium sp. MCSS17_016]